MWLPLVDRSKISPNGGKTFHDFLFNYDELDESPSFKTTAMLKAIVVVETKKRMFD
jgi:hypothetical protein